MSDQEALAPEFEEEEEPRRGTGAFWLALLLMGGVGLYALSQTEAFRVDEVQVLGAERITPSRVLQVSGISPGDYRWLHAPDAVAERALQEPWVRTAEAAWDGGRMTIAIAERSPVGLLPYRGVYLSLDEQGIILEQVLSPVGTGLPAIGGIETTRALRGERLIHDGLLDALTILAVMEEPEAAGLRDAISEVYIHPDRSLDFYMRSGATVQFGAVGMGRNRMASVASRISSLYTYMRQVGGKLPAGCEIDLRVENQVRTAGACP